MTTTLRVITTSGWFDTEVPDDFDLPTYVMGVRAAGYILNPTTYVKEIFITSVVKFDSANPPAMQHQMAPAGTTMQ